MQVFGGRHEPNYTYADLREFPVVKITTWREVLEGEIFLLLNFNTSSREFSDIDTVQDLADLNAPVELIQKALCPSLSVMYYRCVSSKKDPDGDMWIINGHCLS